MLYWVQLWQQKEYRIDRMIAYFIETRYRDMFPSLQSFNPLSPVRRPFFTVKSLLIIVLSSTGVSLYLILVFKLHIVLFLIALLLLEGIIPLFVSTNVAIATIPSNVLKKTVVIWAKKLVSSRETPLFVVGVTGSYGKTSTKEILTHIISSKYSVFSTAESHNTPYSISLDILKKLKPFHTHAVIEYAAYKRGEIEALTKIIKPDVAVLTGIAPQHLSLFGSYSNVKQAKFELIDSVPAEGITIINCQDKDTTEIQKLASEHRKNWRCSNEDSLHIIHAGLADGYLRFTLKTPRENFQIKTKLLGRMYLENVKMAVAVASLLGLSPRDISRSMISFRPSSHFLRLAKGLNDSTIIDDTGTSNPKGFMKAMELVAELKFKKNVLITPGIIDLGEESKAVHFELGAKAGDVFHEVVYSGDSGAQAFANGWKSNQNSGRFHLPSEILKRPHLLSQIVDRNTLVLAEGRLPTSIYETLSMILKD